MTFHLYQEHQEAQVVLEYLATLVRRLVRQYHSYQAHPLAQEDQEDLALLVHPLALAI